MRCSECGDYNIDVRVTNLDTEFKGKQIGYCNNEICEFTSWIEDFQ